MDVSILFKIGAIGILVTVISQLFQHQGRNDLATLTGLAGLVIVLFIVLGMVSDLFSTIKECISKEGMIIDPTYSGKAFWGMIDIIKKNSFYHTSKVPRIFDPRSFRARSSPPHHPGRSPQMYRSCQNLPR